MRIILKKSLSLVILFVVFGLSLSFGANAQPSSAGSLLGAQEGVGEIEAVYGKPVDIRVSILKIVNMVLQRLEVNSG